MAVEAIGVIASAAQVNAAVPAWIAGSGGLTKLAQVHAVSHPSKVALMSCAADDEHARTCTVSYCGS